MPVRKAGKGLRQAHRGGVEAAGDVVASTPSPAKVKVCPRCLEERPILPSRRTCGACFRLIEKGSDRRMAEGLTAVGFWELKQEDRRRMWQTWTRCLVDQLIGPTVATLMQVDVATLRGWYRVGASMPPEPLVGPTIEAIVYLSSVERARTPHGDATRPAEIRSVDVDHDHLRRLFLPRR